MSNIHFIFHPLCLKWDYLLFKRINNANRGCYEAIGFLSYFKEKISKIAKLSRFDMISGFSKIARKVVLNFESLL